MNPNCIIYFLLIILINNAFTLNVDFQKYGEYTANTEKWVIFDSSEFNKEDEIYFSVNSVKYSGKNLLFDFFDDLSNPIDFNNDPNKKSVKYIQKDSNYKKYGNTKSLESEDAYFTVEKNNENLGSFEGKYLALKAEGNYPITYKNTEDNKGKKQKTIYYIVIGIAVLLLIIGLIYYFACYRKKKQLENNNPDNNNNVYINNNIDRNAYNSNTNINYGVNQPYNQPYNQQYNQPYNNLNQINSP